MKAKELLEQLYLLVVHIWIGNERMHYKASASILIPTLRKEIAQQEQQLMILLQNYLGMQSSEIPLLQSYILVDFMPLSFTQQRAWFLHQFDSTTPTHNAIHAVGMCSSLAKVVDGHYLGKLDRIALPASKTIQLNQLDLIISPRNMTEELAPAYPESAQASQTLSTSMTFFLAWWTLAPGNTSRLSCP